MRGNHNLQFKQHILYLIWDVTAEHHNRSWHICQVCYWFCGIVVIYCILLDSKHFRKPIPAKKSHRFYMFFVSFQWEEQPQCLMDDSLQIIFLILMISKRKTKFMCSLTHTPHLQQPTQIKHIASEPPCREIAFVFHFCSSVCLERTVLLYNQGCQWLAVILCIKTATWDTVKEVERF